MFIEDGLGNGPSAGVTDEGQLLTRAVSQAAKEHATGRGLSYNLNTDSFTLISTSASAVLYLKNNEPKHSIVVEAIAIGFGLSTGGAPGAMADAYVYRNPSTGTIVDDATILPIIQNRDFGSTRPLAADAYIGAEGKTLTDGDKYLKFFQGDSGRLFASIDSLLTPGNSLGITLTPPAGNSSLVCYVAIVMHLSTTGVR